MASEEPKPGSRPYTAVIGMEEHSGRWLGWARIALPVMLTSDENAAVADIGSILAVSGMLMVSKGPNVDDALTISVDDQPSQEQVTLTLERAVNAIAELLSCTITVESYKDGAE